MHHLWHSCSGGIGSCASVCSLHAAENSGKLCLQDAKITLEQIMRKRRSTFWGETPTLLRIREWGWGVASRSAP